MKHLYLPLILFLLLVFEGVGIELLPSVILDSHSQLIPHWVLIFLIFITLFYDQESTYFSVLYGVIFGLLIDVVYTDVLGVYMFSYGIVVYIIHVLKRTFQENFFVTTILCIFGVGLAELIINTVYFVIGLADFVWDDYFYFRLLPTVLANLVFLMFIYPIFNKRLARWRMTHN